MFVQKFIKVLDTLGDSLGLQGMLCGCFSLHGVGLGFRQGSVRVSRNFLKVFVLLGYGLGFIWDWVKILSIVGPVALIASVLF